MKLVNSVQRAQLKALITVEPGLRTIQLVDKLDFDFEAVEDALSTLIDAGAVAVHGVIGPNGRQAKAYTLVGVPLPFVAGPVYDAARSAPAVKTRFTTRIATTRIDPLTCKPFPDVVVSSSPPVKVPVFTATSLPAVKPEPVATTKVGRAIAFIKENIRVSSGDLTEHLELARKSLLSAYLRDAVDDGRLKKVGDTWMIGDGTRPKPELKAAPAVNVATSRPNPAAPGPVTVIKPGPADADEALIGGNAPPAVMELPPENLAKANAEADAEFVERWVRNCAAVPGMTTTAAAVSASIAHIKERDALIAANAAAGLETKELAGTSGGKVVEVGGDYDPKAPLELNVPAFLSGGVDIDAAHHAAAPDDSAGEMLGAADHAVKHAVPRGPSGPSKMDEFFAEWAKRDRHWAVLAPAPTMFANPFDFGSTDRKRALFGAWSDGSLHIVREGEPACVLSPSEVVSMLGFVLKFQPSMRPV